MLGKHFVLFETAKPGMSGSSTRLCPGDGFGNLHDAADGLGLVVNLSQGIHRFLFI
ncbi:hypothetical protein [[Mycobacterium] nativiensis]|uniref:Uncharacterized protein n=1 Tax=[Mycobacterium] nativiensis TaxID=2855503 RepID=A0ABU5XXC8_9MYCO|nr:hypothetical protein [Mycolicibacter sp. MYC340]MEB3032625.1 hypothetical protein [Mycolicibacter sp. MYC340]